MERIGDKHAAIGDTARRQHGCYQDAGASPADARFQQIARHIVLEHPFDTPLDVVESHFADQHCYHPGMRYRTLGRTRWNVSEVGYGMWGMGGWTGSDDEESLRALDRAIALGCTFFDTAWVYGLGRSEKLLGAALRARHVHSGGPYPPVRVVTKIPPRNMKWPVTAGDPVADVYPPDHIREYTEKSLENLGVETIDLQQFHVWSDAWAGDAGWQRAVDDLKSAGLVRAFGISVNRWESTNVIHALDTGLVDSVQVVYNIFDQAPQDELFPYCQAHNIAVIARVPFDEGGLTGTLTAGSRWPESDWRNTYFNAENLKATLARRTARAAGARGHRSAGAGAAVYPGASRCQHDDPRHEEAAPRGAQRGRQCRRTAPASAA